MEFDTETGRSITLVRDGRVIDQLFGGGSFRIDAALGCERVPGAMGSVGQSKRTSWPAVVLGCILMGIFSHAGCRSRVEQESRSDRSTLAVPDDNLADDGRISEKVAARHADDRHLSVPEDGDRDLNASQVPFVDVTARSGIEFAFESGRDAGEFAILESLGGGVSAFDYDRDGRCDVLFAGGGRLSGKEIESASCGLFRNLGNWDFADVTDVSGSAARAYYTHGIFPGDFDGDGFQDLAISGYGGVQLFQNQGDGTFRKAGQLRTHQQLPWSTSLAWVDLDHDGHLDLYVTHYVDWSWENHPVCPGSRGVEREVCAPQEFRGLSDAFYRNDGLGGWKPQGESIGLVSGGKGLGVVGGDVNLDGFVDLYVANDTTANFLYLGQPDGSLREVGEIAGVAGDDVGVTTGSMGVAISDIDSDGWPDIWVTNFERELFAFYRNDGGKFFTHASRRFGLAALRGLFVGFGTVPIDFDRDGDRDLFVANGHVSYASPHAPYRQLPLLLRNDQDSVLRQVAVTDAVDRYLSSPHTGRGVARADFDGDGWEDLAVSHLEGPVALLRGTSPAAETTRAWQVASLQLVGRTASRDAYGAVIRADGLDRPAVFLHNAGGSYLSQNEPVVRVTWPPEADPAGLTWTVTWPGGVREVFPAPVADRTVVWVEGEGRRVDWK